MSILSATRLDHVESPSHDDFVAVSPVVERHARIVFRDLDAEAREEAVAEAIAAAFKSHVALKARNHHPAAFPSVLAAYSVLHVKDGRQVGNRRNSRDVLSRKAQQRHGFRVVPLPSSINSSFGKQRQHPLRDHLRDDTRTPVPDQVAFRLDFSAFLQTLSTRDRQMAVALADGHAAKQVADGFGLTPGRVTQLRQQWHREWLISQGDIEQPQALQPI